MIYAETRILNEIIHYERVNFSERFSFMISMLNDNTFKNF